MIKSAMFVVCGLMISSAAMAQDFSAVVGLHQTSADVDLTGASIDGKLGYKLGLGVAFELMEGSKFRTGLLLNRRSFEMKVTGITGSFDFNYLYLDIPALYQYNVNEMVGLFGGLVVGVNVGDDVDAPTGQTINADAEGLIPLLTVGANLMFDDQLGFDFYYERGLGKLAESETTEIADFSTFGANFLYNF